MVMTAKVIKSNWFFIIVVERKGETLLALALAAEVCRAAGLPRAAYRCVAVSAWRALAIIDHPGFAGAAEVAAFEIFGVYGQALGVCDRDPQNVADRIVKRLDL